MDRSAGFALVELLASLVILAMISLLVVSGVGMGRRVWEGMGARSGAGEAVEGAQSILRDRIERAFPAVAYDASAPYVRFEGDADSVRFLAPAAASRGPDVLRRFTLALAPTGELALSSYSDLAADPDRPAIESTTVLRGVRAMEIGYFGPAAPDGAPRWRPEWRSQPAPPELVRVRLAFAEGDRRSWPDLVIRPAATVGAQCLLDRGSGRCRGRG